MGSRFSMCLQPITLEFLSPACPTKTSLSHVGTSCADDTLWTGVPADYTNPRVPNVLSHVRELVDNDHYVEATAAAFDLSDHPSDVRNSNTPHVFRGCSLTLCYINYLLAMV